MITAQMLSAAATTVVGLSFAVTLAVSVDVPAGRTGPRSGTSSLTLAHLQQSFADEKNCEARYLVFAAQADREGHRRVASLFRAAARSEAIHAENHAHALAWLRGEARVELVRTYAESTLVNLAGAMVEETRLATEVYPGHLAQARADRQTAAMRSFNFALAAEDDHARLMADALGTLATATGPTPYFVCPRCGHTVAALDARRCQVCLTATRRFERII